jgi:hypothetical protein
MKNLKDSRHEIDETQFTGKERARVLSYSLMTELLRHSLI